MAKSYGKIYQNKSNVSITPFDIYNLYPVGSIYMSVNSTNPSNYFGGTWEQIKDRFLLACGNSYSNGATGGETTHKLTRNEIPDILENYQMSGYSTAIDTVAIRLTGATDNHYTGLFSGGQAHNNMPPYLAVYIWKRIA